MKKLLTVLGVSAALVSGSAMADVKLSFDQPTHILTHGSAYIAESTCQFADYRGSTMGTPFAVSTKADPEMQNDVNDDGNGVKQADIKFQFTHCPVAGKKGKNAVTMYVDDSGSNAVHVHNSDLGLLVNTSENAASGAKNAHIQILTENGDVLKFGAANKVTPKPLPAAGLGTLDFAFKARIHSEGKNALPGYINSYVPFVAVYE